MILSNDGFGAFHYRSYGTFFLQQNRLHNIYRGFTHYKYYRAFFCFDTHFGIQNDFYVKFLYNIIGLISYFIKVEYYCIYLLSLSFFSQSQTKNVQ